MSQNPLPFWSFFHQIENELSYERWIDKYKLFLDAVYNNHISFDEEWVGFKIFCKALYLQDKRDEKKFDELLDAAIVREKQWLKENVQKAFLNTLVKTGDDIPLKESTKSAENKATEPEKRDRERDRKGIVDDLSSTDPIRTNKPETKDAGKEMYYLPPIDQFETPENEPVPTAPANFLLSDEYFPVTRRQMIKSWQFLRRKERGGKSDEIDFPATVVKIAQEGLFLQPQYKPSFRNRKDTIMIFADYRGSMTAFHELVNRLIKTAREDGGHPKAPVYYFQNFPLGVVYKQPNLTEPIEINEALATANKNFTLAIVISDAGAARGNNDDRIKRARQEMMEIFVKGLSESCAHTIWLNPMPKHRWANTAAAAISKQVLMQPVLEQGAYNFQDTMRTVLRQFVKKSRSAR